MHIVTLLTVLFMVSNTALSSMQSSVRTHMRSGSIEIDFYDDEEVALADMLPALPPGRGQFDGSFMVRLHTDEASNGHWVTHTPVTFAHVLVYLTEQWQGTPMYMLHPNAILNTTFGATLVNAAISQNPEATVAQVSRACLQWFLNRPTTPIYDHRVPSAFVPGALPQYYQNRYDACGR